ncbi:MAG: ribose-5-phosphate isomerase RpiA [Burkholderiaceae bacterium]|nr:ribose-5-phosphate isomerase RpiA [Burkholderiaceae bacterium]
MNQDDLKRAAARAALAELVPGTLVGVGTGSTVNFFIDALGETPERYAGAVSSSERSTERLRAAGISVFDLNHAVLGGLARPVYVDGADEIDPGRHMIKGGGGALTREKIVASAFDRFVCIVDASKQVATLGAFALPIEVIPMARELVAARARALGGEPVLRAGFVTDNGNQILDIRGLRISDPVALEETINHWPGVVAVGLFARQPAAVVLVATAQGVQRLA